MNLKQKIRDYRIAITYRLCLLWRYGRWSLLIIIIGSLINNFWYLAASFVDKYLLDELVAIYEGKVISDTVFLLIGLQLGGKIVNNGISIIGGICTENARSKATLHLDKEIIRRVGTMDSSYFDNPENRNAIVKATQSKFWICEHMDESVFFLIYIVSFVGFAGTFLSMNPWLGGVFLATHIPGVIVDSKNREQMQTFSIDSIPENRKKDYYRSLLTSADTAKDLRLYHLANYFRGIYDGLWNEIRKKRFHLFRKGAVRTFLTTLLSTGGLIMIVVYSVYSVVCGDMTIGEMSLYLSLAVNTGAAFMQMLNNIVYINKYEVPNTKIFLDFMNYENQMPECGTQSISEPPVIEFDHVSFRYPGSETYALKDISFRMEYGEKIALVGVNGAGKTTLIKLLLRFYQPESGEIRINGHNIQEYSNEAFGRLFGACFQNVARYALTLRENIALSRIERREEDAAITEAAAASGAAAIAEELEEGYEINLTRTFDDKGAELSGGQWQKVAIARAFFSDAPVLVFDEPSSALDPEAEDEIFRSFQTLCKDKSGILISHRLSGTMLVDKIILIEEGRFLEMGTHNELMSQNGRYAQLYRMQAEKYQVGKEAVTE